MPAGSQQNLEKGSPAHAAQAGDHTASAYTPKEDAAAKQSDQMSSGKQTVDNHLKPGSHASNAQVSKLLHFHNFRAQCHAFVQAYTSHRWCLMTIFDLQADADKAASDRTIAETGQKPMKTEAKSQI